MPSSDTILTGLTAIANDWSTLAIGWHLLLGVLLLALFLGWHPPNRLLAGVLAVPFVSVSALGWTARNPFNGAMFATLALLLLGLANGASQKPTKLASSVFVVPGLVLVAFGWTYPHFLRTDSWMAYTYAAPFGLLPCPTLSVVIGITLMCGILDSRLWSAVLAAAGFMYGAIGVIRLGVVLDYALLGGATVLAGAIAQYCITRRSGRAHLDERARRLPSGEELLGAKTGETDGLSERLRRRA